MEIREFAEIIREEMERKTGLEVRVQRVPKNNNVVLHGLNIIELESNMFPTIYLESFLAAYEQGISMKDITEKIYECWQQDRLKAKFNIEWFRNFEEVRDKIAYKLINYQSNKELLEKIPHERVLDLAKVYYVTVYNKMIGSGTILIHNNHLKMWHITAMDLKAIATENTPKLFPASIQNMGDVMQAIYEKMEQEPTVEEEELIKQCNICVATNQSNNLGAAVMCYPDLLKEYAERVERDLYILPSSLHEILLVIPKGKEDVVALKEMVYEVNRTQLAEVEILSDSVYYYNRARDTITIA